MNFDIKSKLTYRYLQYINHQDKVGNKEGFCKYYPNNSDEHEDVKWKIFKKLKKEGFDVYTECRFKNRSRADIVAIKNGIGYIIEVVTSEKELSIKNKKEKYPSDFDLIFIKSSNFKLEDFNL